MKYNFKTLINHVLFDSGGPELEIICIMSNIHAVGTIFNSILAYVILLDEWIECLPFHPAQASIIWNNQTLTQSILLNRVLVPHIYLKHLLNLLP